MAISDETQSQPPSSTRSAMTRTPLTSMILEGFPRGHPVARKILLSSRGHFDLRYLVVQIVQLTCGNVMTEFTLVCPFVKCSLWTVYRFIGLSTWGCLQWKPEHRSPSWSSNFFNLLKTWKIPVQWVQSQNEHDIDCTFCNQATCIQRRWHCLFPTVLWWISTWPSCSSKPVYTGQCIQSVSHLLQLQGSHPIFFLVGWVVALSSSPSSSRSPSEKSESYSPHSFISDSSSFIFSSPASTSSRVWTKYFRELAS